MYTVYKHKNKLNGKVYIGITGRNVKDRWGYNGNGYCRNPYFNKAIKKYGWDNFDHKILYENLTKEQAEQMEMKLIAYYDSTNRDKGYNIDKGGSGAERLTEETKRKISESHKGIIPNEETRKKLSKAKSGKNNPNYGKKMSDKHKEILRKSRENYVRTQETIDKVIKARGYVVFQYDMYGNYIQKFYSANDAGRKLNISMSSIKQCCKKNYSHAGGYLWRYEKDGYIENHNIDEEARNIKFGNGVAVDQFDLNGNYINTYSSCVEAARQMNCSTSNIRDCLKNRQAHAKGFKWKYHEG